MILTLPRILNEHELAQFRQHLEAADWQDGRVTAGSLSAAVKDNQQLEEDVEPALSLGNHLLRTLGSHAGFRAAALPEAIYPPKFNRYTGGGQYGPHVDAAVMTIRAARRSLRCDLSATLFLSDPTDYEGGELCIRGEDGVREIKLPAGSMVLYPSGALHWVKPVTRGARLAAFFWIQSLVQDPAERALLLDLDSTIQVLAARLPATDPQLLKLTELYHNLLRRWARP